MIKDLVENQLNQNNGSKNTPAVTEALLNSTEEERKSPALDGDTRIGEDDLLNTVENVPTASLGTPQQCVSDLRTICFVIQIRTT